MTITRLTACALLACGLPAALPAAQSGLLTSRHATQTAAEAPKAAALDLDESFDFRFTSLPAPTSSDPGWQEVHLSPDGRWGKVHWLAWQWCTYRPEFVSTSLERGETGKSDLILTIPGTFRAEGGHIVSQGKYGFGSYRARMKTPATGFRAPHGTVSGFFYYLDKHGEIDVEVLSAEQDADAGVLRFAVHDLRPGSPSTQELTVPVSFSPTSEYHEYGFDWHRNRVEFFIDGAQVGVISGAEVTIPRRRGHIMVNHWTGSTYWGGTAPPDPAELRIDSLSYSRKPRGTARAEPCRLGIEPALEGTQPAGSAWTVVLPARELPWEAAGAWGRAGALPLAPAARRDLPKHVPANAMGRGLVPQKVLSNGT